MPATLDFTAHFVSTTWGRRPLWVSIDQGRPGPFHRTKCPFYGVQYNYTLYTNYTDYTPYTRYTANPEKSTGIEIPAWLIRRIYKRTRPMLQAQPCIPAEYGG